MLHTLWINLLADPGLFEAELRFTRHVVVSVVANWVISTPRIINYNIRIGIREFTSLGCLLVAQILSR